MGWAEFNSAIVTHQLARKIGEVADDERRHERAQDGKHDDRHDVVEKVLRRADGFRDGKGAGRESSERSYGTMGETNER